MSKVHVDNSKRKMHWGLDMLTLLKGPIFTYAFGHNLLHSDTNGTREFCKSVYILHVLPFTCKLIVVSVKLLK